MFYSDKECFHTDPDKICIRLIDIGRNKEYTLYVYQKDLDSGIIYYGMYRVYKIIKIEKPEDNVSTRRFYKYNVTVTQI